MMGSLYLALFLPSSGMTVVLLVYLYVLCYYASRFPDNTPPKPIAENGLSTAELDKLPTTTGSQLGLATECSICLDDIEPEQLARVIPGCNHGFHLQCADTWLSKNPVCPVCRNKLEPSIFQSVESNLC